MLQLHFYQFLIAPELGGMITSDVFMEIRRCSIAENIHCSIHYAVLGLILKHNFISRCSLYQLCWTFVFKIAIIQIPFCYRE